VEQLSTVRLRLRAWTTDDADLARLTDIYGRDEVTRWLGGPPTVTAAELGWHLHPDSWGHGYATEAARAVVDRAFDDGLLEVYAVVRPGNEPSLAVCRRLGMQPLGRTTCWYGRELEAFRLEAPAD
jgi:GNAT superfamily N-acetyltransferase